jgi:hypothetical protein
MNKFGVLKDDEVTQILSYAGLILVTFELVKSLIVKPIKFFYSDVTFGDGMPFKSYQEDVLCRHKNEFEACLLYLRDFIQAIDSEDLLVIQELRKHRNDLAHNLPTKLYEIEIEHFAGLLKKAGHALFKLSNYQIYIEIGSNPKFQSLGIDWGTVEGHEYLLFKDIMGKVKVLEDKLKDAQPKNPADPKSRAAD